MSKAKKVVAKKVAAKAVVAVGGIANEDVSAFVGKSAKIRFYLSKGYKRAEIANYMEIRYQHVRNVEVTLLKKDMAK